VTVSSGGHETGGVGVAIDFQARRDALGAITGAFAATTDANVTVIVNGSACALRGIRADRVTAFSVDFATGAYNLDAAGTAECLDRGGVMIAAAGSLALVGNLGGRGESIGARFQVTSGGGDIGFTGTWQSGAGVDSLPAPFITLNHLLKGAYSGELHGHDSAQNPFAGVLVITFDGQGSVTGGRLGFGAGVPLPLSGQYSIDPDGMGTMELSALEIQLRFRIAVGDNGRVVKINWHGNFQSSISIVGDLVRQ
jgi:hypothetical protein